MGKRKRGNTEAGTQGKMANNVVVSKSMSKMLRHAPPKDSLDSQGWMELPALLRHLRQGGEC